MLNTEMQPPQRLGEPISLTVNSAAATAAGACIAHARPARTNRSTQHWIVELSQTDAAGKHHRHRGDGRAPPGTVEWLRRCKVRPIGGPIPDRWDGQAPDVGRQ